MKNCNAPENQTTRRILPIACATALAVAFTVSLPQPARAGEVTPPDVPFNIRVPDGSKAFLEGHGVGTQNYVCVPSGNGVKFVLFTPQATLFNADDRQGDAQITTHYSSPNLNPDPGEVLNEIHVTWQHSRDTSTFWGVVRDGESSTDSNFVADGAIPWVLLRRVGVQAGPTGGDTLTKTSVMQRVNTAGGIAPPTGCNGPTDIGNKAFVPYTADYFFYTDH